MGNERTVVHLELFVYDFKFLWLKVRFMLSFNSLLKSLIHSLTCALTLGNPVSQKEREG